MAANCCFKSIPWVHKTIARSSTGKVRFGHESSSIFCLSSLRSRFTEKDCCFYVVYELRLLSCHITLLLNKSFLYLKIILKWLQHNHLGDRLIPSDPKLFVLDLISLLPNSWLHRLYLWSHLQIFENWTCVLILPLGFSHRISLNMQLSSFLPLSPKEDQCPLLSPVRTYNSDYVCFQNLCWFWSQLCQSFLYHRRRDWKQTEFLWIDSRRSLDMVLRLP